MLAAGAARRFIVAAPILLCAFLIAGSAWAAGLAVAPLSLTLQPGEQAAALTVTNRDDHPWVIQAQVKRWTQPDGYDHFQADPNLLATPALFRIASDARQVVRVGFTGGPAMAGKTEQAFRLFISEVPPQRAADGGANGSEPAGVQFLLHLVLPVFLPPADAEVRARWSVVEHGGQETLRLDNDGNVHLRLTEVSVIDGSGKAVWEQRGLWYVLAGAWHDWPLQVKSAEPGSPLHIRAQASGTTLAADVVPIR